MSSIATTNETSNVTSLPNSPKPQTSKARWVSQLFQEWGHEVIVANPLNLPMITSNIRKSDKVDDHLLARLARVDPQLLSPVTHRGKEHYPIQPSRSFALMTCLYGRKHG